MSKTASSSSTSKRLLRELQSYTSDPNPALLYLSPVSDDSLYEWQAVLLGPEGTAYEGMLKSSISSNSMYVVASNFELQVHASISSSAYHKRTLSPLRLSTSFLLQYLSTPTYILRPAKYVLIS